jgi:DNA-directed RNA polymerase specialized sigma24 family protein
MTAERDQRLAEAIEREQPRLRNFIRKRVADAADAEDLGPLSPQPDTL